MSFSLSQWWHDLIDHLFKHPQAETVAHPAIAAIALAAAPVPVPTVSGAHDDTILNAFLGRTAQTDAILDSRVAQNSKEGVAIASGTVLETSGVPKRADYKAGVPTVWTLAFPATQFDISDCQGSEATSAMVTVKDAQGNILVGPVQANPKMWNCHFSGAANAEVTMDKDGPGLGTAYA